MPTEPPQLPFEEAIAEIEAQQVKRRESLAFHQSEYPGLPSPSYIDEIDALIQTVRAAWAEIRGVRRGFPEWAAEWDDLKRTLRESENENTTLREQLAQLERRHGESLERNKELRQRLAQVEKERSTSTSD